MSFIIQTAKAEQVICLCWAVVVSDSGQREFLFLLVPCFICNQEATCSCGKLQAAATANATSANTQILGKLFNPFVQVNCAQCCISLWGRCCDWVRYSTGIRRTTLWTSGGRGCSLPQTQQQHSVEGYAKPASSVTVTSHLYQSNSWVAGIFITVAINGPGHCLMGMLPALRSKVQLSMAFSSWTANEA